MKRIEMLNHAVHWRLGSLTRKQVITIDDATADELIGLGVARSVTPPESQSAPLPPAAGVVALSSVLPAAPVYETKIVDEQPKRRRGRPRKSESSQ
jgi:hypothetical protein